jgi:simple sugar transport system ATP-binding protein
MLLKLIDITKRYPGCVANDNVSLEIESGEIHALLGENGAGKSTLVKIIYGVVRPDEGEIFWQGAQVTIGSPRVAQRLGIGMVFQHFSLFEALTVEENIALGLADAAAREGLREKIIRVSAQYGLALDPGRVVHDLSVGERQRIEIVRCLLTEPKLLIMDEPTSVLTPQEATQLFHTLRRLAAEGCAILYISHKLEEVRALCGAATIMRLGRVVGQCRPAEKTVKQLAEMMINAELKAPARGVAGPGNGPPRLTLAALNLPSQTPFGTDLKDISVSVAGGEILGIAGVAGNGQSELMEALCGEVLAPRDAIAIDGAAAGRLRPQARRTLGAGFVPEERNGHGAVPGMSLSENALLAAYRRPGLVRRGMVNAARVGEFARDIIARFDVRTTGPHAAARALSGGNLQKFLIGREVLQSPGVLVINQPTWGVDAGAAAFIHAALIGLARAGAAVVVISQDLDEIFVLADRIAVIAGGRLSPPVAAGAATVESIGLLMGGTGVAAHA